MDRNTPSVANTRLQRWYGWDGASDSLWAQSLRPMVDPREMGGDFARIAAAVRGDADLASGYRMAFGAAPPADDEAVAVDVAKALAAFQETIETGRTPFDDFRDALARGDRRPRRAIRWPRSADSRSSSARASATSATSAPAFRTANSTTSAFRSSSGRAAWMPAVTTASASCRRAATTCSDPSTTIRTRGTAVSTRHVASEHRNFGEFKVPSLRNVARTAPYMHNGSLATLRDVVRHYSEIDEDRLHADGERILKPLHLTDAEKADLVSFLESLSDGGR